MARRKKDEKIVHLLHHRYMSYRHTYCGYVHFTKKNTWRLSKRLADVTCKRCNASIDADGGKAIAFDTKLKVWAERMAKQAMNAAKKKAKAKKR